MTHNRSDHAGTGSAHTTYAGSDHVGTGSAHSTHAGSDHVGTGSAHSTHAGSDHVGTGSAHPTHAGSDVTKYGRPSGMLLDVNGLAIGYGRHTVCHGISFRLDRGEILSVIGPNGSGKTTLLTTLYRQIPPLAGEIRLLGQGVSDFASRDFARTAAILTTNRPTLSLTTCREIVESGRYPYTGKLGFLSENDKSSVSLAMDEAGVSDLAEMNFSKISDGQKQRVMLAKAFAQSTPLLILDEPTSYLDIRYQTEFWEILTKKVRHDNISVIMSVHELSVIKKISDTVLCLSNGKMQFCDDPMLLDDTQICRLFGADPTLYAKWK